MRRKPLARLAALAAVGLVACATASSGPAASAAGGTAGSVAQASGALRAGDFQPLRGDTTPCAGDVQYVVVKNPTPREVYVIARTRDSIVTPAPSGPYVLQPFQGDRLAYPAALRLTGIGAFAPAGSYGPVGRDAAMRVDVQPRRSCDEGL